MPFLPKSEKAILNDIMILYKGLCIIHEMLSIEPGT